MSIGRHNPNAVIPPEVYAANRAKIEQAKALVNSWDAQNEEGHQNHEEMARQLEAKVREGEEARRLLESLRNQPVARSVITQGYVDSSLVESNTSRIEEVQPSDTPATHKSQLAYDQPQQQSYSQLSQRAEPTSTYWQNSLATSHSNPPISSPQPASAWNASSSLGSVQQNTFYEAGSSQQHIQPLQQVSAQSIQGRGYAMGYNAPPHTQNPNAQYYTSANSRQAQSSSRQSNSFPSAASQATSESTFWVNQSNLGSTSQSHATYSQANSLPHGSSRGIGNTVSTSNPPGPMSSHNAQPTTSVHPAKRAPTVLEVYQIKNLIQNWTQQAPPNSFFQVYNQYVLYKSPLSVPTIRFPGAGNATREVTVDEFLSHLFKVASQAEGSNQGALQPPTYAPSAPSSSRLAHQLPSKPPTSAPVPASKPQPLKHTSSKPPPPPINRQLPKKPPAPPAPQTTHPAVLIPPAPSIPDDRKASTSATQPSASHPNASSLSTPGKQPPTVMIGSSPRSTTQANKKSLARDIMFALGKRPRDWTSVHELNEPRAKRQATEFTAIGTSHSQAPTQQPHATLQAPIDQKTLIAQAPSSPKVLSDSDIQLIPQTVIPSSQSSQPTKTVASVAGPEPANPASTTSVEDGLVSELPKVAHPPVGRQSEAALLPPSFSSTPTSSPAAASHATSASSPLATLTSRTLPPITAPPVSKPQVDDPGITPSSSELKSTVPVSPSVIATGVQLLPVNQTSTPPIAGPSTLPPVQTPPAVPKPTILSGQRVGASLMFTGSQPSPSKQSFFDPKPMKKPEPLFLPSSSPELEPENFDILTVGDAKGDFVTADKLDDVRTKKRCGISRGKQRAYVLAPPPPEYLVKYRQQQAARRKSDALPPPLQRRQREGTRTLSVSTSVAGEQAFFYPSDRQSGSPDDALEREVFRLACSRLQNRPCRWDGCGVIMNSIDSLIRHLNEHHKPPLNNNRSNQYFTCKWTQCGRRINTKERHLEGHASLPLRCPYRSCEESYRTASQLFKHVQAKHDGDMPKPSARPAAVDHLEEPSDLPHPVPAYLVVTTSVLPESVSKERHEELGPWVIRNIAGLEEDRPIKQRSRKVTKSANNDDMLEKESTKAYEFLNARSTRYSSYLSTPADKMHFKNLPSANISRMVDEGLTLWSKESDDDGGDELLTRLPADMGGEIDQHDSDEDVVENMLTEVA